MNCKVLGALLLMGAPLIGVERDYQEQLEEAIVKTNAPKVLRLLKRRNKLAGKNFQNMIGWANDMIEERRMLEPNPRETSLAVIATIAGGFSCGAGLWYYFDWGDARTDVSSTFIGGENGFFTVLGLNALVSSYGLYRWWTGPRQRLAKSYEILFALEDTVDLIEKKKKARTMRVKLRQLMAKGELGKSDETLSAIEDFFKVKLRQPQAQGEQ